ncbi:MAG: nuclear transport factor 2 family protein [Alphaproteobacteria bacterium]|nr:nuclear transport factor 2 family protein [Alphaproteobacteria bacterium]MBV9378052.1 nuclear transport factor 2 family protein [Alphaproteobacteria bacterium]
MRSAVILLYAAIAGSMVPAAKAASGEAAFAFSADPATAVRQRAAYAVVHQYEQYLNAGDTEGILDLFAPQSVAEWNDKPTFVTRDQKQAGYNALFKIAKFSTAFGYASIDIDGDIAIVRTFHHNGATVLENGKPVSDYNREVFILRKLNDTYKIVFYMFNTDPVQGEG